MSVQKASRERSKGARAANPLDLARLVETRLADQGTLAPVSLIRVSDLIDGFANFLVASGVESTVGIKQDQAASFVRSLTRSGSEPSLATMHLRRSALRILFRGS